jgi:DNA-binding LacI/PurR family transcriptional regulator
MLVSGRVTMKDVAAALGVSTATVSRALKDDPAISEATRHAVRRMAQRVEYRPSAAARRLRTKSSSLIGVVVQSLGDSYVGDVVHGIQGRARDLGYQPLFFAAEGRADLESDALDVFLSEQVSQLIAVSPTGRPELLRQAVDAGMHVAVINGDAEVPAHLFRGLADGSVRTQTARSYSGIGTDSDTGPISHIRFDDIAAGRLATGHLLALGHRRFAHLSGPPVRSGLLRLLGYRQALAADAMWPQPVLIPPTSVMQSREDCVAEFLASTCPPVAMVAYDDLAAVAALRAAHQAGWRVPQDLSVVGIDDIQFASYTNPGLTTVAQPKHRLGALAVDVLLDTTAASEAPRESRLLVLDGLLVVRESTAPATPAPGQKEAER